jgi:hypothetical protein
VQSRPSKSIENERVVDMRSFDWPRSRCFCARLAMLISLPVAMVMCIHSYLVDPASNYMLVSKIKPCMC